MVKNNSTIIYPVVKRQIILYKFLPIWASLFIMVLTSASVLELGKFSFYDNGDEETEETAYIQELEEVSKLENSKKDFNDKNSLLFGPSLPPKPIAARFSKAYSIRCYHAPVIEPNKEAEILVRRIFLLDHQLVYYHIAA